MDLSVPLKDCAVTLCDFKLNKTCKCDLKLNKNIHLPKNFAEFERISIRKERDSHETDELDTKRNVWCPRAKRRVVNDFKSKKHYKEISSDSESETEVKKKVVKFQRDSNGANRKVVNGFKSKKNYKETYSERPKRKVVNGLQSKNNCKEISSDSESETENKKNVRNIQTDFKDKKNSFAEHDEPKRELSLYEQMIRKRREEKMAFLQSIKIDEVKASFSEAMSHVMTKKISRKKQYEAEKKSPRKSKRLENCHFEFEERKMFLNARKAALNKESKDEERLSGEERERHTRKDIEDLHSPVSFKDAVTNYARYESNIRDFDIQEPKANDEFCLYDKSILESMALYKVSDFFFATTTTISWYPSSDYLILAAGCKNGNIAIWNVCLQPCPLVMWICRSMTVSHSQFSPYNPENLIFSSLDGTVLCADLIQQTFSKVCSLDKPCTYFDFYSASTYLVALNSGKVAIVDKRIDEKTSGVPLHTCSPSSIQTLSNHPVNRNFFLTAHDTKCKLWDLRKLETEPVAENYQDECLRSAFFSPNTGNYILATYRQPYLRLFNFGNTYFENCIELRRTLSLNRDPYSSTATWLPNSGETFSTRHGGFTKEINFYDTDMQDYTYFPTSYKHYLYKAYSFHPKKPALACSHSSGRISVYLKE